MLYRTYSHIHIDVTTLRTCYLCRIKEFKCECIINYVYKYKLINVFSTFPSYYYVYKIKNTFDLVPIVHYINIMTSGGRPCRTKFYTIVKYFFFLEMLFWHTNVPHHIGHASVLFVIRGEKYYGIKIQNDFYRVLSCVKICVTRV